MFPLPLPRRKHLPKQTTWRTHCPTMGENLSHAGVLSGLWGTQGHAGSPRLACNIPIRPLLRPSSCTCIMLPPANGLPRPLLTPCSYVAITGFIMLIVMTLVFFWALK